MVGFAPVSHVRSSLVASLLVTSVIGQLNWQLKTANGKAGSPPGRRDPGLGYDIVRNKVVLFGGRTANESLSDTWIYDVGTDSWREVPGSTKPIRRFSFVHGTSGDYFYIAVGQGSSLYNDIWRFSFQSETWMQLPQVSCDNTTLPTVRYGSAGGIYPNTSYFYVSLGFGGERFFDTYRYDLVKQCWQGVFIGYDSLYSPSYPHARCLHGGTLIGDSELVIFGGCLGGGGSAGPCPAGDTWMYKKDGADHMTWSHLHSCPIPRIYTTMANLPESGGYRAAVLFGGAETTDQVIQTHDIPTDELTIFDPDEQTWTIRKPNGTTMPERRSSTAMTTADIGIYMFGGLSREGSGLLNDLWVLRGDAATAKNTELVNECNRVFFNLLTVHGILMFLGWGVFLQAGAFIARYFRGQKGNPTWFHIHRIFQVLGLLLSIGGLVCGIMSWDVNNKKHFQLSHGVLGLVISIIGFQQPLNGILRPHVSEDGTKTLKRKIWEIIHKNAGRIALILALVNITLGLFLAVAQRAVWITWCVYFAVIVALYIIREAFSFRKWCKSKEAKMNNRSSFHMK